MFKLAPVAQETSMCLRCQYRLSIRRATRPAPQRLTKTPQQLRHFAPGHNLNQEQLLLSDDATNSQHLIAPIRKFDPAADYDWEEIYIQRTGSGIRGRRIYPGSKDSLGFNALGEPAEVLVLRDRGDMEQKDSDVLEIRSKRPDKNPAVEALSSSEMLDKINAERSLVDADQACEGIDNVKTAWMARSQSTTNVVSATRYRELSSQLLNGFTVRQLAVYVEKADASRRKDPLDLRNEFSSTLYTRSAWVPGTSARQPRAPKLVEPAKDKDSRDDIIYERPDRQLSHKPTLVDRILRQCWQLKVKKDEALHGELQIRLHSTHLVLITNHKRGILKQLSESYDAKIEASRKDQIMCITSDYDTCLDILKVIAFTLGNIHTSEIDLPAHLKSHRKSSLYIEPGTPMLRQVEKLTNTVIETRSSNYWLRELHVHYLGPDDADFQDAKRLINQIGRPKSADKGWLIWCGALNPSQTIPAPVDVGNGLPLMSKDQQWSRWCSPDIRQHDLANRKPSSTAPLNTLASPLNYDQAAANSLTRFFAPPEEEHGVEGRNSPYWQSKVSHLDSAVLGQVLFSTAPAEQKAASIQVKTKGAKDERIRGKLGQWRREFVTQVPGVLRLFEPLGAVDSGPNLGSEESLHIRLTPSFKNTSLPIPIEVLPDLEIRISLDNDSRTASVRYARLTHSKQLDLLLPQNTVDLRFSRQTCVYWQRGGLDPRIQQFVQDSNLGIWGTERLRTPTEITLEIPLHAMRSHTLPAKEHPTPILAEYTFTNLEHHSELRIPFRERDSRTDLTYTSIEAGNIGGRRDELALRHWGDPGQKTADLNEADDTASIAQSAVLYKANSASLLRNANALINTIENRPDYDDRDGVSPAFTYGVEKEKRKEAKKANQESKLRRLRLPEKRSVLRKVTADRNQVVTRIKTLR